MCAVFLFMTVLLLADDVQMVNMPMRHMACILPHLWINTCKCLHQHNEITLVMSQPAACKLYTPELVNPCLHVYFINRKTADTPLWGFIMAFQPAHADTAMTSL